MRLLLLLAFLFSPLPAHAVTIDWVTVGDPRNPADTEVMAPDGTTGYGSVAYTYRISKYEITNAQYAEFLNAVAVSDTYGLYSTRMADGLGGITRTGSPESYSYSAIAGRENMPVSFVSFWDSLRFANWLHNGQLQGAQDNGTTEDGAYTLDGYTGADGSWISRNAGATIFLPSEDEWYKAAYYDAVSESYFDYPAGWNAPTTCASPGATANAANCNQAAGDLTAVGSYTGSASPYGTFDQGGNILERNEAISGSLRVARGGYWSSSPVILAASRRYYYYPSSQFHYIGFRVAMIPEPGTALLLATGLAGLAAGRRRHRLGLETHLRG